MNLVYLLASIIHSFINPFVYRMAENDRWDQMFCFVRPVRDFHFNVINTINAKD